MMYVFIYLSAIVLANLSVTYFGPSSAIINAFLFIGLDLVARDHLHDTWRGNYLLPKMTILIAAGSSLSYILNQNSAQIALASFIAFSSTAAIDTVVYHLLGGYPRWLRINGSNIPSAAVDSMVFPALAFGFPLLWLIMIGQFIAKVSGGFTWSIIIDKVIYGRFNLLRSG